MRTLSLPQTFGALLIFSFLPWISFIVPARNDDIDEDWYLDHKYGRMETSADLWTVMLKFHPLFYFQTFFFGMGLAVLRHHLKDESNQTLLAITMRRSTQVGATVGYALLLVIFLAESMQPKSYRISARLTILLPLQGLMMLGLSPLPQVIESGGFQDPIARLYAYAPPWIGEVSYCQYVLQFAAYDLLPTRKVDDPSFFIFLWGTSMLTYKFVAEPGAKAWRQRLSKKENSRWAVILIPPTLLAIILFIGRGIYDPSKNGSFNPASTGFNGTNSTTIMVLPPFVRLGPEVVDMKLNWTLEDNELVFGTTEKMVINPSMLLVEDGGGGLTFVRVARAHAVRDMVSEGTYRGEKVTEQVLQFHSTIVVGSETFVGDLSGDLGDESIQKWGLDGVKPLSSASPSLLSHALKGSTWNDLCEPVPSFDGDNAWLVRKQVSGPEDPKVFEMPGDGQNEWGIAYSSFPPASLLTSTSSVEDCKWTSSAVQQMYVVANGSSLAGGSPSVGVRLDYGKREGMEKNWIAFRHEERLYFVYSVEPHVVVEVRAKDGAAAEKYTTSSPYLVGVSRHVEAIRGSATAVRYTDDEYLALFHTFVPSQGYSTSLYAFQAEPPFAVRRVSRPLPLSGQSFASSLVLQDDKVIIGYGETDKFSRVLVMSRAHLEEQFDWC